MIRFEHVFKSYPGPVVAVHDLSFEVAPGETLVLLGTSGCGKTTTLKMINRLIEPTAGSILIDGTDNKQQDVIRLRRGIGYAIQHIGLFPHMTVAENISVVPSLLQWPRERIAERVDKLLAMVGLPPEEFRDRYPAALSGGQMQRIGVARCLAADPPIILMDEPFGALDPITREQLQNEFLDLQTELNKTIIFVTHDVFEAVKMGDRIALLDQGRLQQIAAPAGLVENPANEFVDSFLGQHRFQLALLTRKIKSFIPEIKSGAGPPPETKGPRLFARNTLIEALDAFKSCGRSSLPVFQRERFIGDLEKKELLSFITSVLVESGKS